MPCRNKTLTLLPPVAFAMLAAMGSDAFAAEGGVSAMFGTYGQSRVVVFGILGAGGSCAAGLLWVATLMGKRRARKTVAAYDAQLAKYRQELRKGL